MAKVDSLQKHRRNQSIEMEILIKNQKEMLEIKNKVTVTKNALDRLISRLDITEEKNYSS